MNSAIHTITFLLIISSACTAQSQLWSVRLSNGDTLSGCTLQTVDDSVLTLEHQATIKSIAVDSVDIIFRHERSQFLEGAGYGTLIGGGVGAIAGWALYRKPRGPFAIDFGPGFSAAAGATAGALGGFLIGGIVGASYARHEEYALSGLRHKRRVLILRMLLSEEKERP
jgi:hypothetical protein